MRPAILVHGGPDGEPMTFMSGDGEISFDDDRIKNIVDNYNKQMNVLGEQYGGFDKIPLGAFPPILDMHKDEANDRVIGRLATLLKFEKRDVPKVGKNVACAVADQPGITFLGKDTVERVKDGRIYHLSIGIDENNDSLGETSTVIEPAAPGAMLLSGKRVGDETIKKGASTMKKDLKRMKAHADRMAKLTAISESLTSLSTKASETKGLVKLNSRAREITHRLSKLMTDMKMTPVEYKALSVTRLAKMSSEDVDMFLSAYDARPKVEGGQRGTTDAVEFSEIGKNLEKRQMKRLKGEVYKDFRKLTGKKSLGLDPEDTDHGKDHEMGGGNNEHEINPGKDAHVVPGEGGVKEEGDKHMAMCMAKMSEHLAAGNIEGAKEVHEQMKAHMAKMKHMGFGGDVKSEDEQKAQTDLQSQVDEIHTNMARLAGMVKELMEGEKAEGHDLEAGEDGTPVIDEKEKVKKELEAEQGKKPGDKAS